MKAVVRSDFAFKDTSTRYSTHSMHPYVAAMVPALAAKMVKDTKPERLLDPFCGGGAVCVEGIHAKVPTTGLDINLLANVISDAKTTWIDKEAVQWHAENILNRAADILPSDTVADHNRKLYLIDYWFWSHTADRLRQIATVVNGMDLSKLKILFQCILSATARDSMLTYRNEVRLHRLRPHDMARFNPDVFAIFRRRAMSAAEAVSSLPEYSGADIRHGDVRDMPFEDGEFSTIVCSPPYGDERNGVPYTQFAKCMLYWLDIPKSVVVNNKRRILGWYDKQTSKPLPNSPVVKELYRSIKNSQNKDELKAFYYDYDLALREMARVTSDKIVIVVGNRVLGGHWVDNAKITVDLLTKHGVRLSKHYIRNLPSKRIPRFGKISNMNGGCIDREDIMIFSHRGDSL